jgi:ubiquinone/menaquinone biosynthesis C-methylase UbiE
VDYDASEIPQVYDRGRSHGPEILALWMDAVARFARDLRNQNILDLGCGTGRFSDALATRFGATVVGLDPSKKMLAQARRKQAHGKLRYLCGVGEAIPLADECIGLTFMSMVFHHFNSPRMVAIECRRVLHMGATVFLRAGTVEQIPAYPYVEFIPATRPLLHERLQPKNEIVETFENAGFSTVSADLMVQQIGK